IVPLVKCRRVGFLNDNPTAGAKILVKGRASSGQGEIIRRMLLVPLLECQAGVLRSALHLHILPQPSVAKQLAAVIDKNTKARGEVNEKPAEEILVEDRRTVRSGFLLLLKLGEQIHGPILRIQHGAAVT